MKKDYCTCFPEVIAGIDISQCCKKHDNMVGMRGTYNPFTPHIEFNKCLFYYKVPTFWRYLIVAGGTFFSWIKYPKLAYEIYKYRGKK